MSSSILCRALPLTYSGGSALLHGHQLSCLVLLQKDLVNKKHAHGRVKCTLFIDQDTKAKCFSGCHIASDRALSTFPFSRLPSGHKAPAGML